MTTLMAQHHGLRPAALLKSKVYTAADTGTAGLATQPLRTTPPSTKPQAKSAMSTFCTRS